MYVWRDRLKLTVATCLGLGYSPILPGTCGALLGIVYFVSVYFCAPHSWHGLLLAIGLAASTWVTIALAPWAERHFQEKDSGKFVTDEVAGYLLTVLLFWPFYYDLAFWPTLWWSFLLTRIIDIVKVPPAKRLEKLPAGWGVVADDLLGSVYTALLLHVLVQLLPGMFGLQS